MTDVTDFFFFLFKWYKKRLITPDWIGSVADKLNVQFSANWGIEHRCRIFKYMPKYTASILFGVSFAFIKN